RHCRGGRLSRADARRHRRTGLYPPERRRLRRRGRADRIETQCARADPARRRTGAAGAGAAEGLGSEIRRSGDAVSLAAAAPIRALSRPLRSSRARRRTRRRHRGGVMSAADAELRAHPTAQRVAADPSLSAWVAANAGSGKTRVLVDRVTRLLLAGTRPSGILCLTFTKAAAAEMAIRLTDRLGAWTTANDEKLKTELQELLG